MTDRIGFVLDTNVLVSAFLFGGSASRRAILKAETTGFLIASQATLTELREVLQRPKFDRAADLDLLESLCREYARRAKIVSVHSTILAFRDARDNKFLELACDGRARIILTGDRDLLDLHPFRGIAIVTPARYLEMAESPKAE